MTTFELDSSDLEKLNNLNVVGYIVGSIVELTEIKIYDECSGSWFDITNDYISSKHLQHLKNLIYDHIIMAG